MDLSRISKKNPYEDLRITLSAIDNNTIEKFDKYYDTLIEKKKMLANLHRKKIGIRVKYSNEYYDLCKKIENLESEITCIENEDHKLDYLLRAASHFLEYTNKNKEHVNKEVINGFFITKDGTNRGQICQNYIKECIGNGYSLSTKSNEFDVGMELSCKKCGVEKLTNPRESYASCPT
jgi:hypothetical protein